MGRVALITLIAAVGISGCAQPFSGMGADRPTRPEGAAEDSCWAQQISPAVIETQTTQTLMTDENGENIYHTETSQRIIEDRKEVWFEIPCRDILTAKFIASLQRALTARGYYQASITGVMDDKTAKAVRLFQHPLGIDSQILSLKAAQALGLITVSQDE